MEKITVVIPNYNGMKYIEECLTTLYAQEPQTPAYTVIVVDNASTDGSCAFITEHFPQVRLIALEENTGFSHAVNVGIGISESPFVLLLNNDTKVMPDFVKSLFEAICRDERIFAVSPRMLMWDRPELIDDAGDQYCVLGWAYGRGKGRPASEYETGTEVFAACGGASLYRRAVFDRIGLFDEAHFMYLEDIDIGYRARIFGYINVYEPKAKVIHYGSASTGSRYNEQKTTFSSTNSVYLIGKNMPLMQWIWNSPFLLAGFVIKFFFFCRKKMGRIYLLGLCAGFRKLLTPAGRKAKVPFTWQNMNHYLRIQCLLYVNLFRFLNKD